MHVLAMTLDFPEHADAAGRVWDRIAGWWDDRIGDGNDTQDLLVEPTQERLLDLRPGETVLDVACGAGRFTRRMAARGARVVAFDRCEPFLDRARRRTTANADRIEYLRIDVTDLDGMLALGRRRFDAAVCTMALMDLACLTPLLSALPELLKPAARFVFSIPHPSFNTGAADYLTARATSEDGIRGQPEPHRVFHRPLGELLHAFFGRGFVLDALLEPAKPETARIPQVLVARLRLAQ